MKKIAFVLVALLMAAPAMADVVIEVSAGPGPNDVTISYDASGEPNRVRAYALDIELTDPCATIIDVNCVSDDYYIHPGSIAIDEGGTVTDWGTCKCSGSYPGTLDDSNSITIEAGSLYVGEANAPGPTGDLVILTIGGCDNEGEVNVTVVENAIRGGVVMEDPDEEVTVTQSGGAVAVALPICIVPDCTMAEYCAGHASGDGTCNGSIDLADLFALKAAFGKSGPPWVDPECCSDYNNSGMVDLADLFTLKANFGTSGYTPSDGLQNCPP
jgi:hypothetical protein